MAPVHILIVPNREIPTVNDLEASDSQLLGHMILTAGEIARRKGIHRSGYRLVINCKKTGDRKWTTFIFI